MLIKTTTYKLENFTLKSTFLNRMNADKYITNLPSLLQAKGFMASSIDSVFWQDSTAFVNIYLGNKYTITNIKIESKDEAIIQSVTGKKLSSTSNISYQQYQTLQQDVLNYFENNGYPFAKVFLDNVNLNETSIEALLKIDKGIVYKIDSIRVFGPAKISKNFIHTIS